MIIRPASLSGRAICVVFLFVVFLSPNRLLANDFQGWYHGALGYKKAIRKAEYEEKPLIIYFHAEWCNWSKKMNEEYLASYEVKRFLRNIPKVEIEPDKGEDEKALKKKYNVTGYPSFLVSVPSLGSKIEKVHPFIEGDDLTNDEFVDTARRIILGVYNKKGYTCYQRKEYEDAVKYYEMAISFDPEDAYAYYGKGIVNYTVAYENRDTSLLEEAEMDYLNALRIDPNHTGSKKELERVRKTMEKMGIR